MDERLPSIKEKLQRQISELGQLIASGVRPDEEARKSLEHSIFRDFLSAQQDEGMSEDDLAAILDQYTALRPDDSFLVKDASEFDAAAFFGLMSFAEGMYKTGYLFAITYLRKAADVCGEVLGACRASEENMAKINKALAVNARLIETISGGDWDSIPGRFLRTIKAFEFYTGLENGIDNIAVDEFIENEGKEQSGKTATDREDVAKFKKKALGSLEVLRASGLLGAYYKIPNMTTPVRELKEQYEGYMAELRRRKASLSVYGE